MDRLYYKYSDFLKDKFSEKVYKLPISLPLTCPNRDGSLGRGGCIYCSEAGGSHENLEASLSIKDQLEKNKAYIGSRYGAKKFIAYFQSFTNTYLPLEDFINNIEEVRQVDDIVGISISTRPDCIGDEYLDYLAALKDDYLISLEYGLQSVNNRTLDKINRGHKLSDYIDGVLRTKKRGLRVCTHLILNLPWDSVDDAIEAANLVSILGVDEIKLHSLYIAQGTKMAKMYEQGQFVLRSKEDYVETVAKFLAYLDKDIAVQRLLSRVPAEESVFSNWGISWWKIQDEILAYMEKQGLYQGIYSKFKKF
ncbi:MAG: TIGR01212 family radical SAM protein [Bacillota bacterium]|nr:TIGR01212 family radical SAM protein [Bacillota bacterium]